MNFADDRGMRTYTGRTALHFAATTNLPHMIKLLGRHSKIELDVQDLEVGVLSKRKLLQGRTPLYLAASMGRLDNVQCLVELGASPFIGDLGDVLPVEIARQKHFRDIVVFLEGRKETPPKKTETKTMRKRTRKESTPVTSPEEPLSIRTKNTPEAKEEEYSSQVSFLVSKAKEKLQCSSGRAWTTSTSASISPPYSDSYCPNMNYGFSSGYSSGDTTDSSMDLFFQKKADDLFYPSTSCAYQNQTIYPSQVL